MVFSFAPVARLCECMAHHQAVRADVVVDYQGSCYADAASVAAISAVIAFAMLGICQASAFAPCRAQTSKRSQRFRLAPPMRWKLIATQD